MISQKELNKFKAYLIEEEMAPTTIDSYLFSVKLFFQEYKELTKINIVNFKSDLLKTVSPKTVNLRLCGIAKYSEFKDTPIKIKRIKIQEKTSVENVISVKQFEKLISSLQNDGNERWATYFLILGKTGARVSEAIRFTKSDLDRGFAEMHTKGKIRKIYFPKSLISQIEHLYEASEPSDYLIVNRYGQQMTTRGVSQELKNYCKKYGIPDNVAHPHSFRHMFAIEFLKRNNNIALLADLLGHGDVSTTMIYLRQSQKDQIRAINKAVNW